MALGEEAIKAVQSLRHVLVGAKLYSVGRTTSTRDVPLEHRDANAAKFGESVVFPASDVILYRQWRHESYAQKPWVALNAMNRRLWFEV